MENGGIDRVRHKKVYQNSVSYFFSSWHPRPYRDAAAALKTYIAPKTASSPQFCWDVIKRSISPFRSFCMSPRPIVSEAILSGHPSSRCRLHRFFAPSVAVISCAPTVEACAVRHHATESPLAKQKGIEPASIPFLFSDEEQLRYRSLLVSLAVLAALSLVCFSSMAMLSLTRLQNRQFRVGISINRATT